MIGISKILESIKLKNQNNKSWIKEFVIALIPTVFGLLCVILCNTNIGTKIISVILGLSLLIFGLMEVIKIFISYKKLVEEQKNSVITNNFTDYTIR